MRQPIKRIKKVAKPKVVSRRKKTVRGRKSAEAPWMRWMTKIREFFISF